MPLSDLEEAEELLGNISPSERQYLRENDPPATYSEALEDDDWADIVWKWSRQELTSENLEYGRAVQAMHELDGGSREQWDAARAIFRNYVDNDKVDISSSARDSLRALVRPHVDDDDFRLSLDPADRSGLTPGLYDDTLEALAKMMNDAYLEFLACVQLIHEIDG